MIKNAKHTFSELPGETTADILPFIRTQFLDSGKTVLVLDDDPTGTQTCYDVEVLTSWTPELIAEALNRKPSIVFILTNSRSLAEPEAVNLAREIGKNILLAQKASGREVVIVSRSDSTLRGHFPSEVDAIASIMNLEDAVRILIPAFIEGGRFTTGDIHYIREGDNLVPVAETPFAQDEAFGYKSSNLREWVEEKTKGRVKASDVVSISIDDIRIRGTPGVVTRLKQCVAGGVCIVNACSHKDIQTVVLGLLDAERAGQKFIYRTSATFVTLRAGIPSGKLLIPSADLIPSEKGSLLIVGSYVPKTTRQLSHLLRERNPFSIEIDVRRVLEDKSLGDYRTQLVTDIERNVRNREDIVLHTSRILEKGTDKESSLRINSIVSAFVVSIVRALTVRPAFIVAKGGITSSDVATHGLGAQKAMVLGQIIPGVPIWKMGGESKFPDMIYVVFPGNVGDDGALTDVLRRLKN